MRQRINHQLELDFHSSNLQITNEYYEKYVAVSTILLQNPKILDLVHNDVKHALEAATSLDGNGDKFEYTSDTVLRIILCQIIEGLSYRQIVVRIDDSYFLRRFVRIYAGTMMDFTTLNKLKNHISARTWKKINESLGLYAVEEESIHGDKTRIDTTLVETNIHWPTDSSLLWDIYRVLARLIEQAREIDRRVVGRRRLHTKKAKRLSVNIST